MSYRSTPQVAVWVEDLEGNYLQTLFVTQKLATSDFRLADLSNTEKQRRPEALPYWSHKRGILATDGLLVPDADAHDLDGVTGATPSGHYDISSYVSAKSEALKVMLEVNRSYDFNESYHPGRFPHDSIYSGSGSSGQPSLIYGVVINTDTIPRHYLMEPLGHGHHSGQDGQLYRDMSGIDTALEILDRIVVTIYPEEA